jgi:uroporphyrinogen-III synthase
MPIRTAYVLATQILPESLVFEAAARGVMIDSLSFIATEHIKDDALSQQIAELKARPIVAVFTSVNSVEAVSEIDEGGGAWTIFCTGRATRGAVEAKFGEETVAGTADTAKGLAEELVRSGDGREVYFFCGDQRRDELPFTLRKSGHTVHELVVYRTRRTPHKVTRDYSGIVFFSPSAVESFFSVNKVSPEARLYAIGPTTASAIREWADNPIETVDRPDKKALILRMIEHFQFRPK